MTFEEASKITQIYGIHLEYIHGKLSLLFFGSIPESLLPFSKSKITSALDFLVIHYNFVKNDDVATEIKNSSIFLDRYVDDNYALGDAAKNFCDQNWQSMILPKLKNID